MNEVMLHRGHKNDAIADRFRNDLELIMDVITKQLREKIRKEGGTEFRKS
jgi:hypothetical protein